MNKKDDDFDHGGFWDSYSKRWETHGDGDGRKFTGASDVLGVEWGDDAHLRRIIERFVTPYLGRDATVLEIGPGGGKWSRVLDQLCGSLILADIAPKMLERAAPACRRKPRTVVLDGSSLAPLADASLDMVFSYDVFIHIEAEEVFRYFSEINRCLKPGGVFVVHTSNFLSRYGFLSFFRQIRDHASLVGKRYGGRMYPLTPALVERFALNSGFAMLDASHDFEDRDLVVALRKVHDAFVWQSLGDPTIRAAIELFDRVGGADSHPLFAATDRRSGELRLIAVAPRGDRRLAAAARDVPEHLALASPLGAESFGRFDAVFYPHLRGLNLEQILHGEPVTVPHPRPLRHQIVEVLLALDRAHRKGLVHGALDARDVVLHLETPRLVLHGLVDPAKAGLADVDAARHSDRRTLLEALLASDIPPDRRDAVSELAARHLTSPVEESEWHVVM